MATPSKSVSLVLGSGGARGLAHIGVIQWLTENGYQIRSISGSSMGALVGGIYAARKLEVYADWVSALERAHVIRLLDPALGRSGLFKGERIIGVLRELIGDCDIAREGRLFDAIRASMATPLVFTPFKHGERTLLDGALVNPLPVAPTVDDGTDLTIAVNLGGPAELGPAPPRPARASAARNGGNPYGKRIGDFVAALRPNRATGEGTRGMLDVALVSMQTMHDTIARLKLAAHAPDVTVEIPRNACGYHEFWRADELIALGRERAAQALAGLEGLGPATDSAA